MTTAVLRRSVSDDGHVSSPHTATDVPSSVGHTSIVRVLGAGLALTFLSVLTVMSWPSIVASMATLSRLKSIWLLPLIASQLISMAAPALVHRRLLRVRETRIEFRTLLGITYASNAISVTLPLAGPEVAAAYTFRQLVRRGADSATAGWTLLISGVASFTTFTLLVIGSAAAAGSSTAAVLTAVTALFVSTVTVTVVYVLRRTAVTAPLEQVVVRLEGWARRITHRRPLTVAAVPPIVGYLRSLTERRLDRWNAAAVGGMALINWTADVLCLAVAIVAIGAPVPWDGLLLAYLAGAGVASLRLTPGGVGVVEAAMTTGLVTAGMDTPTAIAAVLLYRAAAFWLVLIAGWVTLFATPRTFVVPRRPRNISQRRPKLDLNSALRALNGLLKHDHNRGRRHAQEVKRSGPGATGGGKSAVISAGSPAGALYVELDKRAPDKPDVPARPESRGGTSGEMRCTSQGRSLLPGHLYQPPPCGGARCPIGTGGVQPLSEGDPVMAPIELMQSNTVEDSP